ncbi:hypothetical protein NOCARDAX2BIS_80007 [Nocardioides sp. AX2bis]|nr:hypothetical protein NOCARDAX2BIS_80007 [Nocardioides sp. AX2bis]
MPGVVRPEDYGALGDGVHDDGPALQEALDTAQGRKVQLAAGSTYLSRVSIRLPSHTTLRGPADAVLRFPWQAATGLDTGGPYYLGNTDQVGGNDDIVLDGFSVVGGGDGLPAGPNLEGETLGIPAIRLRGVNSFTLTNLDIGYATGISILYQGSVHGTIVGNHVHDSGRDGITGMWLGDNLADITVADNVIARVGDDAIAIAGATIRLFNDVELPYDIRILDNRISGWERDPNGEILGRGIALLAVEDVEVAGNVVARTAGPGIMVRGAPAGGSVNPADGRVWSSRGITITDNAVSGAAVHSITSTLPASYQGFGGIEVSDAFDVVTEGNIVDAAVGEDYQVTNCTGCSIGR